MDDWITLEPLSLSALLLNLLLGAVLSSGVAWYYARFGEALDNRARFARLLPPLCLITILVISVVKASLALSLGLVGALSIVRFRTAIKDPEELIYLFIAIAVGLGLGSDQRLPTVVALSVLMAVLIGARLSKLRSQRQNLYLNITVAEGEEARSLASVNEVLLDQAEFVDMRRLDRRDGTLQLTYLIECEEQDEVTSLLDGLKERFPESTFSFVDRSAMPG